MPKKRMTKAAKPAAAQPTPALPATPQDSSDEGQGLAAPPPARTTSPTPSTASEKSTSSVNRQSRKISEKRVESVETMSY